MDVRISEYYISCHIEILQSSYLPVYTHVLQNTNELSLSLQTDFSLSKSAFPWFLLPAVFVELF